MKTTVRKIFQGVISKTFEVSEVVNAGTSEEYNRLIGTLTEWEWGFEWEHSATQRQSGSVFPKRAQALRALKQVHQEHKNGLTVK